jgi:hypothetical protein
LGLPSDVAVFLKGQRYWVPFVVSCIQGSVFKVQTDADCKKCPQSGTVLFEQHKDTRMQEVLVLVCVLPLNVCQAPKTGTASSIFGLKLTVLVFDLFLDP